MSSISKALYFLDEVIFFWVDSELLTLWKIRFKLLFSIRALELRIFPSKIWQIFSIGWGTKTKENISFLNKVLILKTFNLLINSRANSFSHIIPRFIWDLCIWYWVDCSRRSVEKLGSSISRLILFELNPIYFRIAYRWKR